MSQGLVEVLVVIVVGGMPVTAETGRTDLKKDLLKVPLSFNSSLKKSS